MKIKLVSDLHLEFSDINIQNDKDYDVLILSGDILIAINGKPVTNLDMYKKIMAISLGRTKITVYREGRYIEIMLRIINIK